MIAKRLYPLASKENIASPKSDKKFKPNNTQPIQKLPTYQPIIISFDKQLINQMYPSQPSRVLAFTYLAHINAIENFPNLLIHLNLSYCMTYKQYELPTEYNFTTGDIIIDKDSAIFICSRDSIELYSNYVKKSECLYKNVLWIIYDMGIDQQEEDIIQNARISANTKIVVQRNIKSVGELIFHYSNYSREQYSDGFDWFDRGFLQLPFDQYKKPVNAVNPYRYYYNRRVIE